MNAEAEIAAMRIALDALEDPKAPLMLKIAATRYVYRGEREFFLALLREASEALGLTP